MTQFTVVNHDTEQTFVEESRADAEARKKAGIHDFGYSDGDIDVIQGAWENYAEIGNAEAKTDGGNTEVVENATDVPDAKDVSIPSSVDEDAPPVDSELPSRDVSDDPFEWLPGHFVDTIEGQPAINRKGYAVLSEFYDISVTSDVVVGPEDTDFTYCRCEATAVDADGREYRANGSAHVERGDDMELLLEMADTRATKRVLAIATGVGAVSVSELKNEL